MSGFQTVLRVRYAETDAQGIAFNANYLTWCDVAVTEYFRFCGIPYGEFVKTTGFDFHAVRAEVDFKQPAKFDDEISISIAGRAKGARISWSIEIKRDVLLCSISLQYAVIDTASGRPSRLPEDLQKQLKLEADT